MNDFLAAMGYGNALIVLGVLIFIHELGHYLAARWCQVHVEVFSIGFGPEIAGYTDRRGTRWKLSLLPLGGYVKMLDEGLLEPDQAVAAARQGSLAGRPLRQRALVVAAGPLANLLFAVMVLAAGAYLQGRPVPADFTVDGIGAVIPGSPAEQAGLRAGDRVLRIDGRTVSDFAGLALQVQNSGGAPLLLEIDRDGSRQKLSVTPRLEQREQGGSGYLLGIQAPLRYTAIGPAEALWSGTRETWFLGSMMVREIGRLVTGQADMSNLAGPVGIARIASEAGGMGGDVLLRFMAFLSINLGLLNLLPLPVLDGGHLLFYALEAIRGRPLTLRLRQMAMQLGMVFLLGLTLLLVIKDTVSLLQG